METAWRQRWCGRPGLRRSHSVAVAAFICGLSTTQLLADRQHVYRQTASACVEVKTIDHLSGPAYTNMRLEATRIWLRHGIALMWSQPAPAACDDVVPIVFDVAQLGRNVAQLRKISGGKHADALAATVFSGRSRVVYVSAPRAFEMIRQLRTMSHLPSEGENDLLAGKLLGRVVAHELGHVFLTTRSHSDTGLMRPVLGLRDVLSDEDRMTELSPVEVSRLAMKFALVPIDSPPSLVRRGP